MNITRRKFIKSAGVVAMAAPILSSPLKAFSMNTAEAPLQVHLFSKVLHFLEVKEAGQIVADLGFSGLDLTVRPGGHVSPENVESDLPKAIKAIQQSGSACELITTAVSDVTNPLDVATIKAAAAAGVKYYRSNWFRFKEELTMEESLDFYREKLRELAELNKELGIVGCYQNHSGTFVGASIWEVKKILETANPDYFGAQYDIRHAVAEGGNSWPNGVKLIKDRINTIVLKDFRWEKVNGKWQTMDVPVGEGMVDFTNYFKLLKSYGLNPPVSLHMEYSLGGAEKGQREITVDKKVVFDAMKKDLNTLQQLWKEA
ncbi:MAG: sugar phosphate isomerase/epimerase family protein [Prolixibacteraceae bacterium]